MFNVIASDRRERSNRYEIASSSREKQSFSGIESPKSQSDFRGQKTLLAMTTKGESHEKF